MDERTLGERVRRLEDILVQTGIAGDRNEEYSGCDKTIVGVAGKWGGGAEQAIQPTASQTALEEIFYRIQGNTDRVMRQTFKLEEIANRILGPLPQEAGLNSATEKVPDGTLDHTFLALNGLDFALARLEAAAARLELI